MISLSNQIRIIGLLTTGSVPEGILYRTNCISTLEEKNVKKFLDIVKEYLKIKDVFGKEGEKIFKDFSNFHKVNQCYNHLAVAN